MTIPGSPRNPAMRAVRGLIPMLTPTFAPNRLMRNSATPPATPFRISLPIKRMGRASAFPSRNNNRIAAA